MSTSFINPGHCNRKRLLVVAILMATAFSLSSCATHPGKTGIKAPTKKVVSKYAKERKGGAAGSSETKHIPPVPHTEKAEKQAQQASANYVQAIMAMRNGKSHKALIIFQSIASRYPLLSGPLVNEGLIYLDQEKYDDAEKVLKEATKVNSKNPYAWDALGLTERQLGHFKDSKKDYQKALTLDPLYARAHFNLAVLADLYLNDLPLALKHYKRYQSLQKEPDKNVAIWIKDLSRRVKKQQPKPDTSAEKSDNVNKSQDNS